MTRYKVRVYESTAWSMFTQGDHFMDYHFDSRESLEQIAKRLARDGFPVDDGRKWIMPGSIVFVEVEA